MGEIPQANGAVCTDARVEVSLGVSGSLRIRRDVCAPLPLDHPPLVWDCDCNGNIRGRNGEWVAHDFWCRSRVVDMCREFELHDHCQKPEGQ